MASTALLMGQLWAGGIASAEGINLSWNDCGAHGADVDSDACTSNIGTAFVLIGSFFPPPGIIEFIGMNAEIEIRTQSTTLPDWWKHGSATCRGTTALSPSIDFSSELFGCIDPYSGQGGIALTYSIGFYGPNSARLSLHADTAPVELTEGLEFYAFKVTLSRTRV